MSNGASALSAENGTRQRSAALKGDGRNEGEETVEGRVMTLLSPVFSSPSHSVPLCSPRALPSNTEGERWYEYVSKLSTPNIRDIQSPVSPLDALLTPRRW